jgi:hypothetical protein
MFLHKTIAILFRKQNNEFAFVFNGLRQKGKEQNTSTGVTLTPWRQNPKVHHRIHKSPPPVPILSQLDPIYTPPANLPKIHSDPILPSTPWSSKWSLSFWLSHQNPVHIPLLSHACHMSHPPHSPWFDLSFLSWKIFKIESKQMKDICFLKFSNTVTSGNWFLQCHQI